MWDRFESLGGNIGIFSFDEPLVCTRNHLKKPDADAIEETAQFIALLRQHYPDALVGDIEAYPSISAPDLIAFMSGVQARLKELNVRGMDFFQLDVDWVHFVLDLPGGCLPPQNPAISGSHPPNPSRSGRAPRSRRALWSAGRVRKILIRAVEPGSRNSGSGARCPSAAHAQPKRRRCGDRGQSRLGRRGAAQGGCLGLASAFSAPTFHRIQFPSDLLSLPNISATGPPTSGFSPLDCLPS